MDGIGLKHYNSVMQLLKVNWRRHFIKLAEFVIVTLETCRKLLGQEVAGLIKEYVSQTPIYADVLHYMTCSWLLVGLSR